MQLQGRMWQGDEDQTEGVEIYRNTTSSPNGNPQNSWIKKSASLIKLHLQNQRTWTRETSAWRTHSWNLE